jgi:hypothetical protein
MNRNQFAKPVAVAVGILFLSVAPGLTREQSRVAGPVQTPKVASPGGQQKGATPPTDDFAGLQYTDDQKAEIERIHQETKAHMEVVAKDSKLTPEQKDAMLQGYARLEYGQTYRQLTPVQRRQVLQRSRARRAPSQPPAPRTQSPRSSN